MKAMEPEIEAQTDFAFREILRTGSSLRQIFTRERGDDYS